ncbi:MAG: hypothetical protein PGN24_03265 [Microbacterium arborescens]
MHLRSRGHRLVAYRAAEALGVPDAEALAGLDEAFHLDDDPPVAGTWLRRDAPAVGVAPTARRTAGDGIAPKLPSYIRVGPARRPRSSLSQ